jgi:SPP1 gp7 family putative phage head morphogenesis protein
MTFTAWAFRQIREVTYRRALSRLFNAFDFTISEETPLDDIVNAIRDYMQSDGFREGVWSSASDMITGLMVDNARTWREAAAESGKGRLIYEALRNEMNGPVGAKMSIMAAENARLISTFTTDLQDMVANFIRQESQKGRRPEAIAEDLISQYPDITKARINLIARTGTAKSATELTKARSDQFGWSWYAWHSNHDVRTRKAHKNLDNVLINWNDPPAPEQLVGIKSKLGHGHAGCFPNCRCYCAPLLHLDRVQWPHRVYRDNSVGYMTRSEFSQISTMEDRRAA